MGGRALPAGLGLPEVDRTGGCSLDIQTFFDAIRSLNPDWVASYTAPASSRVCLLMRANTDLSIGLRIVEDNPEENHHASRVSAPATSCPISTA